MHMCLSFLIQNKEQYGSAIVWIKSLTLQNYCTFLPLLLGAKAFSLQN